MHQYTQVLPYCIANTLLAILLDWLNIHKGIDLGISSKGHSFLGLVVAFLIVSRANVSIGRYGEARNFLSQMYRCAMELTQNVMALSNDRLDNQANEWRFQVAYNTLLILRCITAVIMFQDSKIPCWELDEMSDDFAESLKQRLFVGDASSTRWAHATRDEAGENMRVPIIMAFELRTNIHAQRQFLTPPLETGQENKLLSSVDGFMGGYYGIRKFLTTPFPFPLVQMSRTFLFFYVFTVPFALVEASNKMVFHSILIFFFTFGFMGLEYVSIELDDPFGSDPNDFNCLRMTYVAFEDTYTTLLDVDGPEAADRLRRSMHAKIGDPEPEERAWLNSPSA